MLPPAVKRGYLARLERLAAENIMGWHIEQVGIARFWADDAGVPQVAVSKWRPFGDREQAELLVRMAEGAE